MLQTSFLQRYVIGLQCGVVQFIVAVVWSMWLYRPELDIPSLLIHLSIPLITFGCILVLASINRELIQTVKPTYPINITFPLLWTLLSYLAVQLLKVQESGSASLPEALLKIQIWVDPKVFIPSLLIQFCVLTIATTKNASVPLDSKCATPIQKNKEII